MHLNEPAGSARVPAGAGFATWSYGLGLLSFFSLFWFYLLKITVAGTYVLQHVFWGDYYQHKETKDLRRDPNFRIEEQKVQTKGTTNTL
jgi:hypothetical protein